MGQVSSKLRRATNAYFWFCPACQEMHPLPDGWQFNGNLEAPTFTPSFKHEWGRPVSLNGEAQFRHESAMGRICHYIVTAGQVAYCGDCTHAMAGQTIPMPDLPPHYQDGPNCEWSDGG